MFRLSFTFENQNIIAKNQLILEANNDYNIEMRLNSNETCSNKNQFIENKINHNNDNKESGFVRLFKRVFKTNKTGKSFKI